MERKYIHFEKTENPKINTERQIAIKKFYNQYKTKLVIREKEYSHQLY